MGFLSNIFKKEAKKMFTDAINRAANEVIDTFGSTEEKCARSAAQEAPSAASATPATNSAPAKAVAADPDEESCYGDYDTVCKRV